MLVTEALQILKLYNSKARLTSVEPDAHLGVNAQISTGLDHNPLIPVNDSLVKTEDIEQALEEYNKLGIHPLQTA